MQNKEARLVPDLVLLFKKALYRVKASDQHLHFKIFLQTSTSTQNKNKLYKIAN